MLRLLFSFALLALAMIAMLPAAASAGDPQKQGDSYIKVEVKGKLTTGIIAIGGETTGTTIATPGGTLELDLGKNKDLRTTAEKLNGKAAIATGTLTIRRGVEVPLRFIVTVTDLKAAN